MTCLGLDNNLCGSGDEFFQTCLALDGLKIVSRCLSRAAGAGAVRARPEQRTACMREACFTPLHLFSLIKGLKKSACLALEPRGNCSQDSFFPALRGSVLPFIPFILRDVAIARLDAFWDAFAFILCIIDETPDIAYVARERESLNRLEIRALMRCSPSLYQRKQLCQA